MRQIAAIGGRALLVAGLAAATVLAAEVAAERVTAETAGQLTVVSQPGVEVVWEGVGLGATDDSGTLVIEGIPPGSYELQLQKAGYRPRASQVEIVAGAQSVRLQLKRPPVEEPAPKRVPKPVESRRVAESPLAEDEQSAEGAEATGLGALPSSGAVAEGEGASPPAASSLVVAPPAMGPAPTASLDGEAALAGVEGAAGGEPLRQDSALPPVVYLLGLGLLTATGAVALRRHQQARAQAALAAPRSQLAFQLPREVEDEEPPEFLDDIQRREQDLEKWLEARDDPRRADAIDVEVVDLGPAEESD